MAIPHPRHLAPCLTTARALPPRFPGATLWMMFRARFDSALFFPALMLPALLLLAACGGGGGGGATINTSTRLSGIDVEFGPTTTTADLVVSLTNLPSPAPVLLQVVIELPAALAIAPTDPLQAVQAIPTLRGARTGGRYIVVCGDDHNPEGVPLQNGDLFRLRLVTTTPRQVGTHAITLSQLLVAQNNGIQAVADSNPTAVTAIVN